MCHETFKECILCQFCCLNLPRLRLFAQSSFSKTISIRKLKPLFFCAARAKYFRGRKIHQDWDVKVDQAEFRDLSVSAGSTAGVTANISSLRTGAKSIT